MRFSEININLLYPTFYNLNRKQCKKTNLYNQIVKQVFKLLIFKKICKNFNLENVVK